VTPVEAAVRLAPHGGLAWLDGDGSRGLGRRSWVGCAPVEVRRLGPREGIDALRIDAHGPRWLGYLAYDACWRGEGRHPRSEDVAWFGRYDALCVFEDDRMEIVGDSEAARERLRRRLSDAPGRGGLAGPADGRHVGPAVDPVAAEGRVGPGVGRVGPAEVGRAVGPAEVGRAVGPAEVGRAVATPREDHEEAIAAALELIAAGDIYQVNLARMWEAPFAGDPLALYLAMREASPVPLGAYFDAGDRQVLARTMERFLSWEPDAQGAGRIETRPIKGTIARSGRDAESAAALQDDPKERAEHSMIVDLMRNDLGRVATIGSVEVEQALEVEPYRGLHHLVSVVAARTRPGTTAQQVLEATFPPGSVTGCPKIRAIEVIEELEAQARGVYTGALGWIGGGGMSLAVAIRTATVGGGTVRTSRGAGSSRRA